MNSVLLLVWFYLLAVCGCSSTANPSRSLSDEELYQEIITSPALESFMNLRFVTPSADPKKALQSGHEDGRLQRVDYDDFVGYKAMSGFSIGADDGSDMYGGMTVMKMQDGRLMLIDHGELIISE